MVRILPICGRPYLLIDDVDADAGDVVGMYVGLDRFLRIEFTVATEEVVSITSVGIGGAVDNLCLFFNDSGGRRKPLSICGRICNEYLLNDRNCERYSL